MWRYDGQLHFNGVQPSDLYWWSKGGHWDAVTLRKHQALAYAAGWRLYGERLRGGRRG